MLLKELLAPERILIPIPARDKPGVIEALCHHLVACSGGSLDDVQRAVMDRERDLTTGIGFGIAVPHGRSPTLPELAVVAGRTAEPVPFDSIDGEPVRIVFLLSGPETAASQHVKALSRIVRLVRRENVRQALLDAPDPAAFYNAIVQAETW